MKDYVEYNTDREECKTEWPPSGWPDMIEIQ
jgi:hypothetical protein